MDRNFLSSQNGRKEVLRECGSDVKDCNYISRLRTKDCNVFEASLIPFAISDYLTQVPPSCVPLSLRSLPSPADQNFPPAPRSYILLCPRVLFYLCSTFCALKTTEVFPDINFSGSFSRSVEFASPTGLSIV